MLAWLEGDPNSKSDLELWGVTKLKYIIVDLEGGLSSAPSIPAEIWSF